MIKYFKYVVIVGIIAIAGNSLLLAGNPPSVENQFAVLEETTATDGMDEENMIMKSFRSLLEYKETGLKLCEERFELYDVALGILIDFHKIRNKDVQLGLMQKFVEFYGIKPDITLLQLADCYDFMVKEDSIQDMRALGNKTADSLYTFIIEVGGWERSLQIIHATMYGYSLLPTRDERDVWFNGFMDYELPDDMGVRFGEPREMTEIRKKLLHQLPLEQGNFEDLLMQFVL